MLGNGYMIGKINTQNLKIRPLEIAILAGCPYKGLNSYHFRTFAPKFNLKAPSLNFGLIRRFVGFIAPSIEQIQGFGAHLRYERYAAHR